MQPDPALEGRRQDAPQGQVAGVGVGAGQEDRELVAADAEDPVGPAQAGGQRGRHADEDPVAADVALDSLMRRKSSRSTMARAKRCW